MPKPHPLSLTAFVAACALFAACSSSIAYKPMGDTAPAAAHTVTLSVLDKRPSDQGGADKRMVGQVWDRYGRAFPLTDPNPDVVIDTVTQATTDALAQAGLGVGTGDHTLVGLVQHFWMEGMTAYEGTVTVSYALLDVSGTPMWTKEISSSSGSAPVFKSASAMTRDIFAATLNDLAKQAATAFQSDELQQVLR